MNYIMKKLNENCISITQFAEVTGYDRSTIYKQVKYGFKPRLETICVYASALEKVAGGDIKIHMQKIAKELGVWIPSIGGKE